MGLCHNSIPAEVESSIQPMNENYAAVIEQWAEFGRRYAPQRPRRDWSAVQILIDAAAPRLRQDSDDLRRLLDRSSEFLGFPDPLLCDLGTHRWLDRENSYSDWLAWVLESLDDFGAVLRVLGIPENALAGKQEYTIDREWPLAEGNENSTGRIDLLIRCGAEIIGVEVKTFDKQYLKQHGYKASLQNWCNSPRCILIANCDVPAKNLHGFELRRWEEVSLALRREIAPFIKGQRGNEVVGAMMLAFVGAVEQNLLELSVGSRARYKHLLRYIGERDDSLTKRAADQGS